LVAGLHFLNHHYYLNNVMELVTPDLGLIFWTGLVFLLLLFILTKFVFKPILSAVNTREQNISEALELAEKTKAEMKALQAQNENLLREARAERDAIVKDAKEVATEANKIAAAAREAINADKAAAIAELKTQVASFSLEIAEKIVRGELSADGKQKALAEKLAGDINMN
jgi:F-type H+-transporting ATPase subunit b